MKNKGQLQGWAEKRGKKKGNCENMTEVTKNDRKNSTLVRDVKVIRCSRWQAGK